RLGQYQHDEWEGDNCHIYTDAVVPLLRSMPHVVVVRLFAKDYDLTDVFALWLGHLRVLHVYHADQVHRLDVLAENRSMTNLTQLLLHPHHLLWNHSEDRCFRREAGFLPLSMVQALLRSPYLSSLTHLGLCCSSLGNEGCEEIVRGGALGRLKHL